MVGPLKEADEPLGNVLMLVVTSWRLSGPRIALAYLPPKEKRHWEDH
jgi:hypothetical protein